MLSGLGMTGTVDTTADLIGAPQAPVVVRLLATGPRNRPEGRRRWATPMSRSWLNQWTQVRVAGSDVLHRAPRSSGSDELGLVGADDRFRQGAVERIATEPTDDTAPSGAGRSV